MVWRQCVALAHAHLIEAIWISVTHRQGAALDGDEQLLEEKKKKTSLKPRALGVRARSSSFQPLHSVSAQDGYRIKWVLFLLFDVMNWSFAIINILLIVCDGLIWADLKTVWVNFGQVRSINICITNMNGKKKRGAQFIFRSYSGVSAESLIIMRDSSREVRAKLKMKF